MGGTRGCRRHSNLCARHAYGVRKGHGLSGFGRTHFRYTRRHAIRPNHGHPGARRRHGTDPIAHDRSGTDARVHGAGPWRIRNARQRRTLRLHPATSRRLVVQCATPARAFGRSAGGPRVLSSRRGRAIAASHLLARFRSLHRSAGVIGFHPDDVAWRARSMDLRCVRSTRPAYRGLSMGPSGRHARHRPHVRRKGFDPLILDAVNCVGVARLGRLGVKHSAVHGMPGQRPRDVFAYDR